LGRQISEREREIAMLEKALAAPDAYAKGPEDFQKQSVRLDAAKTDLESMEEEWLALEEKKETLAG